MRIKQKSAFALGAGMVALMLAACSESPSAPELSSALAVGDVSALGAVPVLGKIIVCKTGNSGGVFDVTRTGFGASTGTVSGLDTQIPVNTCLEVANDQGGNGVGSYVTIDEDAAPYTVQTISSCVFVGANDPNNPQPCTFSDGGTLTVNSFHAFVITYNNDYQPPVVACTYTKGWYRNKGASTVTAVDGLTADQARQIFAATPGQPGSVTFGGNNSLLNLYQQYLAALLNGGATGPAAVQSALSAVAAGTDATGLNITTTLTKAQISEYTATLSSFNEGTLLGYPHC